MPRAIRLFVVLLLAVTPARAEQETPARAEQETPARVEQETPARAEQETPARVEQETPARAEQETPARAEQETPARTEQETPARTGTGALLHGRCRLYFEFLGRTGAGREDTFNQDPFGMGYCAGLVRGVVIAAQSFMPDRVCVPPGTTIAQTVHRVIQYLDQHPEESAALDVELVLRALEDRFRCP